MTPEAEGFLRRAIELAAEARKGGNPPFGSLLVGPDGVVLREERNETSDGDQTRHPELELARWAAGNVAEDVRPRCTVYTSGEHCPMCSAAHAWVGLGPIVYAASTAQLSEWRSSWGLAAGPVLPLSINAVAPDVPVSGPAPELVDELRELHRRASGR